MTALGAFGDPKVTKTALLTQLQAHYDRDQIVRGQYWEGGKGCAVGCTIHSSEHSKYETTLGIPSALARLEDAIFEGLSDVDAKEFPIAFIRAITVGADLSLVGWQFLTWLVTDGTPTESPANAYAAAFALYDAQMICAAPYAAYTARRGAGVATDAYRDMSEKLLVLLAAAPSAK